MGIGVVVATNRLIPIADHRPAALQVQCNTIVIKAKLAEISPREPHHLLGQHGELRMPMELPHAIEIPRPGTTLIGIALCLATKPQQSLDADGLLEGIEGKLG